MLRCRSARLSGRARSLLWITRYHLAKGSHLIVLKAWGFEPRTVVSWNKIIAGLGNGFVRDVSEHVVYAVRGDVPPPDAGDRPLSLFHWKKTKVHSQKPNWPEQQVELILPNGAFVRVVPSRPRSAGLGARGAMKPTRKVFNRYASERRQNSGTCKTANEGKRSYKFRVAEFAHCIECNGCDFVFKRLQARQKIRSRSRRVAESHRRLAYVSISPS